jgi:hypothetical protein
VPLVSYASPVCIHGVDLAIHIPRTRARHEGTNSPPHTDVHLSPAAGFSGVVHILFCLSTIRTTPILAPVRHQPHMHTLPHAAAHPDFDLTAPAASSSVSSSAADNPQQKARNPTSSCLPSQKTRHIETHIWHMTRKAPDLVVGPKADPLGDLPVLASLLGQDLLDLERLVCRLMDIKQRAESCQQGVHNMHKFGGDSLRSRPKNVSQSFTFPSLHRYLPASASSCEPASPPPICKHPPSTLPPPPPPPPPPRKCNRV